MRNRQSFVFAAQGNRRQQMEDCLFYLPALRLNKNLLYYTTLYIRHMLCLKEYVGG